MGCGSTTDRAQIDPEPRRRVGLASTPDGATPDPPYSGPGSTPDRSKIDRGSTREKPNARLRRVAQASFPPSATSRAGIPRTAGHCCPKGGPAIRCIPAMPAWQGVPARRSSVAAASLMLRRRRAGHQPRNEYISTQKCMSGCRAARPSVMGLPMPMADANRSQSLPCSRWGISANRRWTAWCAGRPKRVPGTSVRGTDRRRWPRPGA